MASKQTDKFNRKGAFYPVKMDKASGREVWRGPLFSIYGDASKVAAVRYDEDFRDRAVTGLYTYTVADETYPVPAESINARAARLMAEALVAEQDAHVAVQRAENLVAQATEARTAAEAFGGTATATVADPGFALGAGIVGENTRTGTVTPLPSRHTLPAAVTLPSRPLAPGEFAGMLTPTPADHSDRAIDDNDATT